MKQSKPMFLILFSVLAVAMSGCGRSNNQAGAPLPVQPGLPGQFPQTNFPGGMTPLSGITAQGSMVARVDSASVTSNGGGGWGCSIPQGEQFQLIGQSQDGVISITGQSMNCNGQIIVQVQLSQLVLQDIQQRLMFSGGGGWGYHGQPIQIGSVTVAQVSIGRAGSRLYNGALQGGASILVLVNGTLPYHMFF